jgi:hypothetical protein
MKCRSSRGLAGSRAAAPDKGLLDRDIQLDNTAACAGDHADRHARLGQVLRQVRLVAGLLEPRQPKCRILRRLPAVGRARSKPC